jgi:hypothetical protein
VSIKTNISLLHARLSAVNRGYIFFLIAAVILSILLGKGLENLHVVSPGYTVKLKVNFRALKNDEFQIFYRPVYEHNDLEKNSKVFRIKGREAFQEIMVEIPDSVKLSTVRFDPGSLERQSFVDIKRISLEYEGKTLVLFDSETKIGFFYTNEYMTHTGAGHFTLSKLKEVYDPFIYSGELSTEYNKLLHDSRKLPYAYLIAFISVFSFFIYLFLYRPSKSAISIFYSIASCLFVLLLLSPWMEEFLQWCPDENTENRTLTTKPAFNRETFLTYPRAFENYYNDNFGFRKCLVEAGGWIRYHVFRSSPQPEKCAVGKDGWIFLNGTFYEVTQDLTRQTLESPKQLDSLANVWELRKETLAKQGIKYFKASWPDKHVIYPEMMPFCMQVLNKDTVFRFEQAIHYLQKRKSPVKILDVTGKLKEVKKIRSLYHKYDSHWNDDGAFEAYTELLNFLSVEIPELKPKPREGFNIEYKVTGDCDLSNLLGLDLEELKPFYSFKNDSARLSRPSAEGFPKKTVIVENPASFTSLTVLIYRDSFTDALIPFLSRHFRKMVLIWDPHYSDEIVKKVKPDMVIECYATRYFR